MRGCGPASSPALRRTQGPRLAGEKGTWSFRVRRACQRTWVCSCVESGGRTSTCQELFERKLGRRSGQSNGPLHGRVWWEELAVIYGRLPGGASGFMPVARGAFPTELTDLIVAFRADARMRRIRRHRPQSPARPTDAERPRAGRTRSPFARTGSCTQFRNRRCCHVERRSARRVAPNASATDTPQRR